MESVFLIDEDVKGTHINESLLSDNKDPLSDDTHEVTSLDVHVKEEVADGPLPQSDFPELKYDVNGDCFKQQLLHEQIDIKPEIEDDTLGKSSPRLVLNSRIGYKPYGLCFKQEVLHEKIDIEPEIEDHTLGKSIPELVLNSGLQASMLTSIPNRPYRCSICTATFKHNAAFNEHIKMHSANKTPINCYKLFKCSICSTRFMFISGLQAHMLTHTGVKPFLCTICNFKTDQKNILVQHIKTHLQKKAPQKITHSKRFACIICKRSFPRNSTLQAHILTHTGEKPFMCVTCPSKFNQKSSLTQHLKIHLEEKPVKCNLCEYRCAHQKYLEKHMITHRSGKIFRCFVCNIYFVLKSNLDQHMETHVASQK